MHQQDEITLAALAGLWHDVGKIAVRVGEHGSHWASSKSVYAPPGRG